LALDHASTMPGWGRRCNGRGVIALHRTS
jgi:hypothetical protein